MGRPRTGRGKGGGPGNGNRSVTNDFHSSVTASTRRRIWEKFVREKFAEPVCDGDLTNRAVSGRPAGGPGRG